MTKENDFLDDFAIDFCSRLEVAKNLAEIYRAENGEVVTLDSRYADMVAKIDGETALIYFTIGINEFVPFEMSEHSAANKIAAYCMANDIDPTKEPFDFRIDVYMVNVSKFEHGTKMLVKGCRGWEAGA